MRQQLQSRVARLVVTSALALLAGAALAPLQAQGTGRVVGRVVSEGGVGLTGVTVQVVGTTQGAVTGVDGRYIIPNVRAGTLTLHARRLGFQPKTVTGLMLAEGQTLEQNVTLAEASIRLEAAVVTAEKERGSVSAALDAQKNATGVVSAVTAEQIAKSPDSDAAQAVQRVSGVTVQDGKYVFVRGLGERYTTTSLNGARIPSPEPERKVVPLDLFPSGLLQSITTSKTFTPDQPGDFSGASVEIRTREFPAERQFTWGASVGYNVAARGESVPFAPGVGGEQFAMAGSSRNLPEVVRAAGNLTNLSSGQKTAIINAFRNVWLSGSRSARPNSSVSASLGGNDPVLGQRIGYLLSGTYSFAQEVREDEMRALARPGSSGTESVEYNRFEGTTGRSSAMLGGLANFSTLLGASSRLSLNNTYSRTADNDARRERGTYEDLAIPVVIERLDYVERSVWSSQLAGEHDRGRHHLEWAGTLSGVTRDQPDRSEFAYEPADATGRNLWLNTSGEGAVRTFAALDERAAEGRADYRLALSTGPRATQLKAGVLGRSVGREADTRAFGIFAPAMSDEQRALSPAELFDGRFTSGDAPVLSVRSLAQGGSYTASDKLTAGYLMADVGLFKKLRAIAGLRAERSDVLVQAVSTLGEPSDAHRGFTDLLPSLALTLAPTASQNVRLSVTRTLARPEYREIAGIRTRDVLGGVDVRGNPALVRTLIDNADLRWEWYPSAGEVLGVGVFAKRFQDPIERVFRPSNTNSIVTFVNAEGAENYGVELEARKGLGALGAWLAPLTAFGNVTLMRSEIRLGASEASSTNPHRAMAGQAPYVVNAGLTYASRGGATSATLLLNRVGERIVNAGELPLPDVKELPRSVLDFSLRVPAARGFAIRFDAKNLLDADYLVKQGNVTREAWRAGRTAQLGFAWQP